MSYENPACDAAGAHTCIGTTVKRYPLSEAAAGYGDAAILCIRHFHAERLFDIRQGIKPAEWNTADTYNAE